MKLKYYLRGLGTGILISVVILAASYHHQGASISNTEIEKRAADLGMVMQDTSVLAQEKTKKPEKPENTQKAQPSGQKPEQTESAAASQSEAAQSTAAASQSAAAQSTAAASQSEAAQSTATASQSAEAAASQSEAAASQSEAAAASSEGQAAKPEAAVVLQVKSGDSSVSVSKRAQQAGLVDNAAKLDSYLCKNGYDKHICVGSYEIPQGATMEQIAKKITRS